VSATRAREAWVEAYEALRATVVTASLGVGAGLGLILRAGLAAWMRVAPPPAGLTPAAMAHGGDAPVLAEQHRELVHVWAQMAWTIQQEGIDGSCAGPE
jgi:hypothetical protein